MRSFAHALELLCLESAVSEAGLRHPLRGKPDCFGLQVLLEFSKAQRNHRWSIGVAVFPTSDEDERHSRQICNLSPSSQTGGLATCDMRYCMGDRLGERRLIR